MRPLVTVDLPAHEVLYKPAQEVHFPITEEFSPYIDQLVEVYHSLESPYGKPAGLAAPQVGIPYKFFCFQIPEEAKERRQDVFDTYPLTIWCNASYTPIPEEGTKLDREMCYSVPDRWAMVERYYAIRVSAYTLEGEKVEREARGFLARLLQHEIGHTEGELYLSHVPEGAKRGTVDEQYQFIEEN